jgi:hypothetical protein
MCIVANDLKTIQKMNKDIFGNTSFLVIFLAAWLSKMAAFVGGMVIPAPPVPCSQRTHPLTVCIVLSAS